MPVVPLAERLALLQTSSFFADLDTETLTALAEQFSERELEPGQTLFYEGEVGQACYIIVSGKVQVVKQSDPIYEVVLEERLPGALIGELALFGGERRMATIRALEPTLTLELTRPHLDAVIAAHPQLLNQVIKTLHRYLQHVSAQVSQLERQVLGGGDLAPLTVGQMLGQYQLESVLGQGGMATVFRARDTLHQRWVALKTLSPRLSQRPGFLDLFRREAIALSDLQHPHILPVYAYGERGGVTYIVTKLIEGGGGTLAARLGQPLPLAQCAHYLAQVAAALDYAHQRGLIHRDVKPTNILVDAQSNCYLADFGIAALVASTSDQLDDEPQIIGTPTYISPEQASGDKPVPASDVYSLGVVLYEMVTGRPPFEGLSITEFLVAHMTRPVPPARERLPDLPLLAEAVIRHALAKHPNERFPSAGALARAWRQAIGLDSEPLALDTAPQTTHHHPHPAA
jgi:CRP-like cAMP-binding protein